MKPVGRLMYVIIALIASQFLIGCGFLSLDLSSLGELPKEEKTAITGQVGLGNGTLSLTSAGCTDVSLYNVDTNGKKTTLVRSVAIKSDGTYEIVSTGVNLKVNTYLLETICTNFLYQRYLTGLNEQNLNYGSTLISWFPHTSNAPQINQIDTDRLQNLYALTATSASLAETYTALTSSLKADYESTTQTLAADLLNASPQVLRVQVPNSYSELAPAAFSIQAYHWNPAYTIFTEWKINGNHAHNGGAWTFTPSKNSQGVQAINMLLGQEDSGAVDIAKPHALQDLQISIANNFPALVPNLTYTGDLYTNQTSLNFEINTGVLNGGIYSNCETFTSMAIAEESYSLVDTPLLNPLLYTLNCAPSPQIVNHILSGIEGRRHVKVWSRDSAGNISTVPQKFEVTYDITAPVIQITSPSTGTTLGMNTANTVSWTSTEANPGTYRLFWVRNGDDPEVELDREDIVCSPALSASSTSCAWTVPNENLTGATLRVSMTDLAGNEGHHDINFSTATAPNAPVLSLDVTQVTPTDSRTILLDVTYPGDATDIYYSVSSTSPASTAPDWEALSNDKTFTLPNVDGAYTIYAWVKNAIAVSSPDSVQVTLDRTAPVLSAVTIENGATHTSNSYVGIRLQGTDLTGITHYCVQTSTQAPASAPDVTTCDWTAITSTTNLNISPTVYLGNTAGLYYAYVWLRDGFNHVSTRSEDSIQYTPPAPATLSNALASTVLASSYPPDLDELFFGSNSTVYIKWSFAPASGVPAGNYTLTLEHSTDGIVFTNLNLTSDVTDCSAGVSAPFTHCYSTNNLQNVGYHQYRITAQAGALKTSLLTPPLNLSISPNYQFRILAGNTTLHDGEYALTSPVKAADNQSKSIAMDSQGNIYLVDFNQGLLHFNPGTGVLKKIVNLSTIDTLGSPWGYRASDFDGNINNPNTVISQRAEIVVDPQDNLIIWDNFNIRKLDFAAGTLTTIIGRDDGYGSRSGAPQSGLAPRQYGIRPVAYVHDEGTLGRSFNNLISLPNGDILFRGRDFYDNANSGIFAVYRSNTQTVDEFQVSGSFISGGDTPTTPNANTRLMHALFKINALSGEISQMTSYFICPNGTTCNQHSDGTSINANLGTAVWNTTGSVPVTFLDEYAYVENPYSSGVYKFDRSQLQQWNSLSSSWVRVAGTGTVGFCDDSIMATSCNMDLRDVYFTPFNQILLWDGTRIRRLNANSSLTTLVGTSVSSGDGGPALNSKIATVRILDAITTGVQTKIAFYEADTFKLREIRFANNEAPAMHHIAGNGTGGSISVGTVGSPALSSPTNIEGLFYMPSSENIFALMNYNYGTSGVFQLDRSNWLWTCSFICGNTIPDDLNVGDGLAGSDIGFRNHHLLFLDNTRALTSNFSWYQAPRGSCPGPECSYGGLKLFDPTTAWRQYNLAQGLGEQRTYIGESVPDGLSINQFFPNGSLRGPASWDSVANEFIFLFSGNNNQLYRYAMPLSPVGNDYAANHATGSYSTYTLDQAATGFAIFRSGGDLMAVYCTDNGEIWKKNLTAATAATQLQPTSANFKCAGDTIRYIPARDSVVFAFTQNGIYGIAEIDLSP